MQQSYSRHIARDSHGDRYEYVKCNHCGRECSPPRRDRLTHTDDCPVRGDDR
jgi:uncharacterized OB-fold protein